MSTNLDSLLDAERRGQIAWHDANIGGISTLDSFATRRALDEREEEDDEQAEADRQREQAVQLLEAAYKAAVQACDVDSLALFSPSTTYRSRVEGPVTPNVGEVILTSLDHADYFQRAMAILVNAAAGKATQRDAQMLLDEAGRHWADSESDFV